MRKLGPIIPATGVYNHLPSPAKDVARRVLGDDPAMDLSDPEVSQALSHIHVWPIDLAVCQQILHLDFKSDSSDEIIAATSIVHRVPLLTRDKKILKSKLTPLA